MMSAETILDMQSAAAAIASRDHMMPMVPFENTLERDLYGMPNLGDYVPYGWRLADCGEFDSLPGSGYQRNDPSNPLLFVDSSGWGSSGEAAMTPEQFYSAARSIMGEAAQQNKTVGFGLVEQGQFQCYVGVFVRER